MSELSYQFSKYLNITYEKMIVLFDHLSSIYNLILSYLLNIYNLILSYSTLFLLEFKIIWSEISKGFIEIFETILLRLNIEFSDLKTIFNSFYNSLSPNGRIGVLLIAITLIIFIFIVFANIGKKKSDIKINKVKSNSIKNQLLKIEIDLIELQDKYLRKVISLNSYIAETKRVEEKFKKI